MNQSVPATARLASIDVLRGLVIVIMVLDHVRDYLSAQAVSADPLDPASTTVLMYATRWITHLCAPTFVFLAGTSAWIMRARGRPPRALARFLVTRGLWLVLLELTVIGFAWSFSIPYLPFLQVIWVIGAGLAVLGALVFLPRRAVLGAGVAIIVLHNLLDGLDPRSFGPFAQLWMALHVPGVWVHDGHLIAFIAYPLLPWTGVLLLGYGLGAWFLEDARTRDRRFVRLGLAMIALLLVLRGLNLYGDPGHWSVQPTLTQSVMDFLRVQKYPPSLLYVCATLGPVFLLIPALSRWHGATARFFLTFGAVPLFAYVVHLYLMHAVALGIEFAAGQNVAGQFDTMRNLILHRELYAGTGFGLGVVYLVWAGLVLVLHRLCRWYGGVRRRHRSRWWLSYL